MLKHSMKSEIPQTNFEVWIRKRPEIKISKYKSSIKELNRSFLDSMLSSMDKKNEYAIEVLGNYSGSFKKEQQKINLIKARETYSQEKDLTVIALEEKSW